MPQVHVENMAAAHLIAAQRLHAQRHQSVSEQVAGEAFNISDFPQNIVSLCEQAASITLGSSGSAASVLLSSRHFRSFCALM